MKPVALLEMSPALALAVTILAGGFACGSSDASPGGDVSDGGAGTSSAAGSGGGGNNNQTGGDAGSNNGGGSAGAAGGQDSGTACPLSAPTIGAPCRSPGHLCSYGGGICCGEGYRCGTNGKWEIVAAGCACILPVDAGNLTDVSSHPDGANMLDATAGSCAQETIAASCDLRSDCHSVFYDPHTCGCAAIGCCAKFQRCAEGKNAKCTGPVACTIVQPYCEGPYVVSYTNACYEGCVRATECGP